MKKIVLLLVFSFLFSCSESDEETIKEDEVIVISTEADFLKFTDKTLKLIKEDNYQNYTLTTSFDNQIRQCQKDNAYKFNSDLSYKRIIIGGPETTTNQCFTIDPSMWENGTYKEYWKLNEINTTDRYNKKIKGVGIVIYNNSNNDNDGFRVTVQDNFLILTETGYFNDAQRTYYENRFYYTVK
tara:strand:+ start:16110 stop:16661 length:552 start_codon:yes stop_codon:yes gene_type:complete